MISSEEHYEGPKVVPRWDYIDASVAAMRVERRLAPHVSKLVRVGSLGRREKTVKDIDILVEVPEPIKEKLRHIRQVVKSFGEWDKGGDRAMFVRNVFNSGIKLELFLSYPPRNFHALHALRTGPEERSLKLINGLLSRGYPHPHAEIQVGSPEELFEMAGL